MQKSLVFGMIQKRSPIKKLLDIFWSIHDTTQKNRQGPDAGTNYRSIIFYFDSEQKRSALESKEALKRSGKRKNL